MCSFQNGHRETVNKVFRKLFARLLTVFTMVRSPSKSVAGPWFATPSCVFCGLQQHLNYVFSEIMVMLFVLPSLLELLPPFQNSIRLSFWTSSLTTHLVEKLVQNITFLYGLLF